MSAIPPRADIVQHGGNVRFVQKRTLHYLFDHLISDSEQRRRYCEAERFGGHQLNVRFGS